MPEAQLSEVVSPPAAQAVVRQDGAGDVASGGDRFRLRPERHRRALRVGGLVVADVARVSEAELPGAVRAPATHAAVLHQRAGVRGSGSQGQHRRVEAREAILMGKLSGERGAGSQSELAAAVAAPAAHEPAEQQRAGVRRARGEGEDLGAPAVRLAAVGGCLVAVVALLAGGDSPVAAARGLA